jgi:ribonuclease P protein component
VLPAERRLRRREDFTATVRDGRRAAATGLVIHVRSRSATAPARAGFIVSRSVGPAVDRNRLRRQLRHVLVPRLASMPTGTDVVVRVTPAAMSIGRRRLAATLDQVLARAVTVSTA